VGRKGDGPVNALDGPLRGALVGFYERLGKVRLTDYKCGSSTRRANRRTTRVLIEFNRTGGHRVEAPSAVNANIVRRRVWEALVDSLEYAAGSRSAQLLHSA